MYDLKEDSPDTWFLKPNASSVAAFRDADEGDEGEGAPVLLDPAVPEDEDLHDEDDEVPAPCFPLPQ